jgi:Flp pilus assembly protein TadG
MNVSSKYGHAASATAQLMKPGEIQHRMRIDTRAALRSTGSALARAHCAAETSRLRGNHEKGQAMVEMALVLPVLLLVVTGIFAFGLAFNNYVMLTEATSVGARALAISRGQTTDPCATASAAVYAAAPLLVPSNLSFTFVLNGTTYTGASCSSGSSTTGAAGNLVQGDNAVLTVTYPCSLAVYGANVAPSCSLQAQMTELVQ